MNPWAQESLCRFIYHEYVMWLKKKKESQKPDKPKSTQRAKIILCCKILEMNYLDIYYLNEKNK